MSAPASVFAIKEENGVIAALDTTITPELHREYVAREVVSKVQRLRKKSGFAVDDRIRLDLECGPRVAAAVQEHASYIAGKVLATQITVRCPQ